MKLLSCNNVTLGYQSKTVQENVNFFVDSGDYLCIVGENGAGKSTLVKTLLGLQPKLAGEILFENGLKQTEIGYLPQQTDVQRDFPASAWEIVLSGCQSGCGLRPFYSKKEKETAEKNIEKMGIAHLKKRCYRELSGGQQQRVLLARALCAAEKLILLDEPVSGLDPTATADMYSLINDVNKKDGMTVIMISHDIPSAVKYSNRILHLGKNTFFGSTDEYVKSPVGRIFADRKGDVENA